MIQIAYVVVWWLILVVIGLLTFPLVSRVCGGLLDKGYSISKILGLLLLTYFSWLLASLHLLKFGYVNISVSLLLLLALSLFLGRKNLSLKTIPLRTVLISEGIFTAAFALFVVFLLYKPDIFFAYSEDFMDFAFLQSVLRSDYFPPADPWLAGETLPYYYGGHLLVAILTLISKVPSSISYNLAVAMFFAVAVSAAYGLGYNITKRKLYGFVTLAFVCFAGFISGAFQLAAHLSNHEILGHAARQTPTFLDWLLTYDTGAQVIPHTGNSYPYYTFLQGDLHANTMSIPFQLMFITLLYALFARRAFPEKSSRTDYVLDIFIIGISLGFFSLINGWEYPTYAALMVFVFVLLKIDYGKRGLLGIIVLSLLLYVPYYVSRGVVGVGGVGLVAQRTVLADFMELFALLLFAMLSLFCVLIAPKQFKGTALIVTAVILLIAALGSFWGNFQIILILTPLILFPLYQAYKAQSKKETEFVLLLVLTGALVALFCDIAYIDDALSGDAERFNTVLKFYLQIWVLFGVASAFAVYWVMSSIKGKAKAVWAFLLVVLVIASVIQPVGLTAGWASGKRTVFGVNRGTLDGAAYVKTLAPGDYEAIRWINGNIKGQPVLLEAPGGTYQFTSHVSTMTGLPTVVGWVTHEVMWRDSWDKVAGRDTEIDTIYSAPDSDEALALLRKYNVEYIYVGKLEKERYEAGNLLKFAGHPETYTPVYENPGAAIYQVRVGGTGG